MMVALGIYLRRWQRAVRRWLADPRFHTLAQTGAYFLAGFFLSAGSLGGFPQPLALGFLCVRSGWSAALVACGAGAGYLAFWGNAGWTGIVWLVPALGLALLLGHRQFVRESTLLMPALAAVIVAVSELFLQTAPIGMFFLRVAAAFFSGWLFSVTAERRDPVLDWLLWGIAVLALAQVLPFSYLGLGYIAAGLLGVWGAFPAAALSGLALDLAQITPVPMAAVLCLAYLLRLIPKIPRRLRCLTPALVYPVVMALCGAWDLHPLPGLLLGGLSSLLMPVQPTLSHRRGETGFTQVRLEMVSNVLAETEQLLLDIQEHPIDEDALVTRAMERACNGCPHRNKCKDRPVPLPASVLRKPLGSGDDLPQSCRKTGRLLQELRRSQEQLRAIRADRDRREEYRWAVAQQYHFLSDYLQDLSDSLAQRTDPATQNYQPELAVCAAPREGISGDRCLWFAGVGFRYYIVLCDGMGTGPEAARDGKIVANLLKKLLSSGFPPEYALRSVNSLCALQGRAGAVTIDLAELRLDTGKATVYKWGAAPSYLLSRGAAIKIGSSAPPPGLSVTDGQETAQGLSLRRGEILVLLSDGAGGGESLRKALEDTAEPPRELAARILACRSEAGQDDATVAVVRLNPCAP